MIVWVVTLSKARGEEHSVHDVYDSREAAFEELKKQPNMTVYVDEEGNVRGRPVRERKTLEDYRRLPEYWATAEPFEVKTGQAT